MLKLKEIFKEYVSGDTKVEALKGVSINFRRSEFVSILGPSGCGKTTLLNIIGGLDRYTTGDLTINGKSTKDFKDRDWDTYRNHSVGFVFQNYNLIPHQSVLGNVELALTLSGVSKKERREKAKNALIKVGLEDQINKHPNQLSGGQMQRVAIARAIVNNPDIILADEPTGALDTETSIQVMEILKEIAKDRLVIMVTHNPDLAYQYSTRIIRLLDGKVTDDSNPYNGDEKIKFEENVKRKPSMSFFTALALSLKNLFTKKARTFMVSFAGSIGIIGIALILSLSDGFQNYITKIEEDTLSTYPVVIEESTIDMTAMISSMGGDSDEVKHPIDENVYSNNVMSELLATLLKGVKENDLKSFKKYLDNHQELSNYVTAIKYGYNASLNIYKSDYEEKVTQLIPYKLPAYMGGFGASVEQMEAMMAGTVVWDELLDNDKLLDSQYDVIEGKWPSNYDEAVLVINKDNEISDYLLYALGLIDDKAFLEMLQHLNDEDYKQPVYEYKFSDLLNLTYKLVPNSMLYVKGEDGLWANKKDDQAAMKEILGKALDVKIVGIIRPKENAQVTSVGGVIGYSKALTEYIVNYNSNSDVVKEQIAAYQETQTSVLDGSKIENELVYNSILDNLGLADLESPSTISIYPVSFEAKDEIIKIISEYNEGKTEEEMIQYTDYIGIMMSSISTIIDAIAYVLIAFVAISLIVSSIMIGIITYISVLERTKEIGVLRSIGASKKDISRVFNAETLIIGFTSGFLGILLTVILDIPVNLIIDHFAGIGSVAALPVVGAIILVIISMALTLIAGIIPSHIAAKKDPVIALRSE